MNRQLSLTPTEAEKFKALAVGESMRIVREGVSDDPIHPEGIWSCEGCGRTYPEYINGCVNDHGSPRGVRLAIPEGPMPPVEFVQACAPCETCGDHRSLWHIGTKKNGRPSEWRPCPDCRIELMGPMDVLRCGRERRHERHGSHTWNVQCQDDSPHREDVFCPGYAAEIGLVVPPTVTLGYAYAVGEPLPIVAFGGSSGSCSSTGWFVRSKPMRRDRRPRPTCG